MTSDAHRIVACALSACVLSAAVALPAAAQRDLYQPSMDAASVAALEAARKLRREGRLDDAAARLERLVEAKPDYFLARYNLGLVYLGKGQADQALPHLESAAKIQRENRIAEFSIYNTLGWAHLLLGDYAAAERAFLIALENKSSNSRSTNIKVLNNLGVVEMYGGDLDQAERYFQQVEEQYGSRHAAQNLELLDGVRRQREQQQQRQIQLSPQR